MHRALATAATLVLASTSLPAQVIPHERALPMGATGAWGNGALTWVTFRDQQHLHQMWVRGDQLPKPYVVSEVGERPDESSADTALTFSMTIVLDNSSLTWSAMGSDPTKNLSAQATQVVNGSFNFPAINGQTPNRAHLWFKLAQPWIYTGPHFLVEKTWTPGTTSGTRTFDNILMNNAVTLHLPAGASCGGMLSADYTTPTYTARLTGAPANALVLWLIAVENVRAGAIRLPVDLSPIGFTGCELGVVPLVILANQANAAGDAALPLPFTLSTTDTDTWSVQAAHQVPTTPAGWGTTNVVNSIVGGQGLMRSLRVDRRGAKGPDSFNTTGPVLLVRGQ